MGDMTPIPGDVTPMPPRKIRVAVTQAEPEWLDLQKSTEKTCKLIAEAAQEGAELVTFPELWIPGYPCWIWYERSSRPFFFKTQEQKDCQLFS